jgi:dCMP deaminase
MSAKQYKRPSWDEYFLGIMDAVAKRATCDRGRSGCVIARDKRILATGYVGSAAGTPHCDEAGHEFMDSIDEDGKISKHCVRTAHAEQNAIAHAARNGVALEGATLYCRMTPCYTCAKMIINAGIVRVVALHDYHAGSKSKNIFKVARVKYQLVEDKIEQYAKQ